jgi:hypothetical protein
MLRKIGTTFARTRCSACRTSAVALSIALGAVAGGCIDPESPLIKKSAEGCDEFVVGSDVSQDLAVHAKVRAFMQAASDFGKNATDIKASVMTACTNIATDLGATNTWGAIKDPDQAITNADRTGAVTRRGRRAD